MQIVNINLVPSGVNPIVYASQHDNGRVVRFHLMNNSSEWTLDPSDTVRADITRPDGTEISIPMTNNATPYSDLTISYDDLDQEGVYVGEVVITDQYDNVTGSLNFILKAEADPYGDDVTTETAVGNPCTFDTDISDTLVSLKAAILASGGGGTPLAPIPIVGHSELNLVRCGKNLLPNCNSESYTANSVTVTCNDDGTFTSSGTATGGSFLHDYTMTQNLNIISGMYLHCGNDFNSATLVLGFRFTDGTGIDFTLSSNNRIIDLSSYVGKKVNKIRIYGSNGTIMNGTLKPMVLTVSTATAYESYNGTPYLVQFGQTVYGGVYDAKAGKVRITHVLFEKAVADMNNWDDFPGWINSGARAILETEGVYTVNGNVGNTFGTNFIGNNDVLFLPKASYGGLTQTQWMANYPDLIVQFVMPLATPIEIDVSELSVDTIVGVNNIVSDCNGDVEVTYIKKV